MRNRTVSAGEAHPTPAGARFGVAGNRPWSGIGRYCCKSILRALARNIDSPQSEAAQLRFVASAILILFFRQTCPLLFLRDPAQGLLTITLLLIIFFMIEGISKVVFSLTVQPFPNWGRVLASGVVGMLLSAVLWASLPVTALWLIRADQRGRCDLHTSPGRCAGAESFDERSRDRHATIK